MIDNVLKIEVSESVNVIDVFVRAKKWAVKKLKKLFKEIKSLFIENTYTQWRAIPIRGADVSSFKVVVTNYSL